MHARLAAVRRGVIGVLHRGERFLVIRRAAGVAKGGRWCFPGGHLEPEETSKVALRREFREELSIEIDPVRRLGSIRVAESRHVLAVWCVEHVAGDIRPAPAEVAAVRWMKPDELRGVAEFVRS
jgi:8-oxo-dGTP pyrophosphatase MutT (NUDIX family)